MKDTVRWGLIGAGRIARQFAEDILHTNNATLQAVASRDQQRAERFAKQHQLPKAYGDYQTLYDDPDIDAIYIATPHTHHLRQSTAILEAGKAVLCEKPMTINTAECLELIEQTKQSNQYLMEGMWTYFLPAIQKAKQWLLDGKIGTLKHIKADFGYPQLPYDAKRREYNAELAGGCLLEMGIYPVAAAWFFSQQQPQHIRVLSKHAANGVEDDVAIWLDYGDTLATLGTSFRCKLQNWCYLIGDQGYIAIPDFWRASECHLYELDTLVDSFQDHRKGEGFEFEIQSVSNDILSGKTESDIMPLSNSLIFQQLMDSIREKFEG